jgi:general secretion pathway protein B
MSFILDALKKSEIERQRQALPGLIDVPVAAKRRRLPWWAMLLGGLLIANVVVLVIVLTRNGALKGTAVRTAAPLSSPSRTAAAASPRPGADGGAGTGADHFSPLDSAPQYAPEIPVQNDSSIPPPAAAAAAMPAVPAAAPRGLRHTDPLLSQQDAAADNDEVLPSINELSLSGQQTLPELHLDVHVYGTRPAERFVYINMRKYHEGATLQEGPVVERIRRDGAVLNFHGVRFLLPRQS